MHLLLGILLKVQLLLEAVEFGPELVLIPLNIRSIPLECLNSPILLLLHLLNLFQFFVKLCKLFHKLLPLLGFIRGLFSLQLDCL